MACLQTSSLLFPTSSTLSSSSRRMINAAIQVPKVPRLRFTNPKTATKLVLEGLQLSDGISNTYQIAQPKHQESSKHFHSTTTSTSTATIQLYAILEEVADRIEMHINIGEQRNNWNVLLLNSINMITLTASIMAGIAGTVGAGMPILALKLSSALLFTAASGMLLIMNKIQPSQLAEEQRNATRLFKQIQTQIQNLLALREPTEQDVKETMEKVLALDKAYPLPLLGAMLEKYPKKFEAAAWWPKSHGVQNPSETKSRMGKTNGWSEDLEDEMREIISVVKSKDFEDYERLAIGSAFVGHNDLAAIAAVAAGSLSTAVNAFQHGGQVGMVFEMYRNCAGFFNKLEDTIEATLGEQDLEKRENGELFEMKIALELGRSLPQLRELASKSASCRRNGTVIDEMGSKLF
ncbi:probable F-box protein At4g22030 [Rosa chinensis]|uniref:probable F-box protein At4g22030 n=1 Tax=Rosa chinensis TaxID=74649 RepID=UPI001AD8BB43|nr:probable F-box protein At4g22030 [Rosa chinensis]